jgi:hypothetical protein
MWQGAASAAIAGRRHVRAVKALVGIAREEADEGVGDVPDGRRLWAYFEGAGATTAMRMAGDMGSTVARGGGLVQGWRRDNGGGVADGGGGARIAARMVEARARFVGVGSAGSTIVGSASWGRLVRGRRQGQGCGGEIRGDEDRGVRGEISAAVEGGAVQWRASHGEGVDALLTLLTLLRSRIPRKQSRARGVAADLTPLRSRPVAGRSLLVRCWHWGCLLRIAIPFLCSTTATRDMSVFLFFFFLSPSV